MNFYDFCRCVQVEPISKSAKNKHTFETQLSVLRRHPLKMGHPSHCSHILVEHTNNERGDEKHEYIPRVIGMSIPRRSNARLWAIFALPHFEPFSIMTELFTKEQDPILMCDEYRFSRPSMDVMTNWEAVHECEDERDADRLRKRAQLTAESTALTASISNKPDNDELNFSIPLTTAWRAEQDFRVQQIVLELQQAGWFTPDVATSSPSSVQHQSSPPDFVYPSCDEVTAGRLKRWKNEIKRQEESITTTRRNTLNPEDQVTSHNAPETENISGGADGPIPMLIDRPSIPCQPMEAMNVRVNKNVNLSPNDVIFAIGTHYSLNTAQWKAFRIITAYFIAKYVNNTDGGVSHPQLTMLMTGLGGTGKTHVVKAVQEVMKHYGCSHLMRFLAPTGSAAALIDGMMVHKGLGLKIKSLNKGKVNRSPGASSEDYSVFISVQNRMQLREEWKNVDHLLIDKVSLLSLQLLAQIDHALCYAKEKPELWFGGVSIIFAGDFYQFPPVGGNPLYSPIASYAGQTDTEVQKRLGRLAWKTVNVVISLREQQQMKEDPGYGAAVNRLRTRDCTQDDVDLFNTRVMKTSHGPDGVDLAHRNGVDTTAIVSTNELCEVLNGRKAQAAFSHKLVAYAALDQSAEGLTLEMREKLLHLNMTALKASNTLPGFTTLAVGMPVILRVRNISTDLGITNGSQGAVQHIYMAICAHGFTYAICALVEFPHSKVCISGLPPGVFPIVPSTWTVMTLLDCVGGQKKVRLTRYQLPIQPVFAITGHSSQGKTLPSMIVNLHDGGFAAYVAASRARTREGLCIMQPVTLQQLNKHIPTDLLFEASRFAALEHNTLVWYSYSQANPVPVPDAECDGDWRARISAPWFEGGDETPCLGKRQPPGSQTHDEPDRRERPKKCVRQSHGPMDVTSLRGLLDPSQREGIASGSARGSERDSRPGLTTEPELIGAFTC